MNPQQIVIGIVGIIVGFILGFFVAQGVAPSEASLTQPVGQLPENHPELEISEQLQGLIDQAEAAEQAAPPEGMGADASGEPMGAEASPAGP